MEAEDPHAVREAKRGGTWRRVHACTSAKGGWKALPADHKDIRVVGVCRVMHRLR